MVITTPKPIDEIVAALKESGVKRLLLLGCGDCATICNTGSEAVLSEKTAYLTSLGFIITGSTVVDVGCNAAQVSISLVKLKAAVKEAEAIVVFSCGLGIQSAALGLREPKKIFAACNTHYVGILNKSNNAEQLCSLCGECNLTQTGAYCVKTLCPKEMGNGPCGGVRDGKCEVIRDRDCVWVSMYQRNKQTVSDLFERISPPRSHAKGKHPQKTQLK